MASLTKVLQQGSIDGQKTAAWCVKRVGLTGTECTFVCIVCYLGGFIR